MTHLFYPLLFLLLLLGASCEHRPYPAELRLADSLMNHRPDSALALLQKLKPAMGDASEAVRMYHRLLCIKAADKAYKPHTSDSTVLSLVHYYEKKRNRRHLPEAYYYAGRVYRDLGDAPQALEYFQKSLEIMREEEGFLELKSRVYSQMGTLFLYQGIYTEALKMFRNSLKCDELLPDTSGLIFDIRDIATSYRELGKVDSALYYYQEAYNLAQKVRKTSLGNMVLNQMASIYSQQGEYHKAKEALWPSLVQLDPRSKSPIYSIASKLYHRMGNSDSASFYYKELLDCGTIYAKKIAHQGLAEIAVEQKNPQEALVHLRAYKFYNDSIERLKESETVHRMNSLYNYQLREKEILSLEIDNFEKAIIIIVTIFVLVALIITFILYAQFSKNKELKLSLQIEKLQQLLKDENPLSREDLEEQYRSNWERLCKTDIYIRIQKLLKENITPTLSDNDFQEIERALDECFVGFRDRLYTKCSLNPTDYRICLLTKYKIPPGKIAVLTPCSKETVSSVRRRLYLKVFGIKGSPKEWDEFIRLL